MDNLLPIKIVVSKTVKLIVKKEYLYKFIVLGLIMSLLSFLANTLFNLFSNYSSLIISPFVFFLTILLLAFVYFYAISISTSFIYNFCFDVAKETLNPVSVYFKKAVSTSFILFITILSFGLIIFFGCILLLIPGIIWGIKYFFAPMVSAIEGKKAKEALKQSKDLVKGYFWQVLLRLIVFYVITSFPGIIISSINENLIFMQAFFIPITTLFYIVLYINLKYKHQNI